MHDLRLFWPSPTLFGTSDVNVLIKWLDSFSPGCICFDFAKSPKQRATLRKYSAFPHLSYYQISCSAFETKMFLRRHTEIHRYLLSKCIRKLCSANVFSDIKQKHICWKICKLRKVFGCDSGAHYFQCQKSWGS